MRPDIAFPGRRVAVFLDGCFWHSCPEHGNEPRQNTDYWASKLARNTQRDERVNQELDRLGWTVLRFWEHKDPALVARSILSALSPGGEVGFEAE